MEKNQIMKDLAIKVLCGAVVAMASGIGSILGSEGAKAGLKALAANAKKSKDPIGDLPEPTATVPDFDSEAATEVTLDEPLENVVVEPETQEVEA